MKDRDYEYESMPGTELFTEATGILEQMSELYSNHYGFWGNAGPRPGQRIRLAKERIRPWLEAGKSLIALARFDKELVGYAISIRSDVQNYGIVSWVTQFVIHESHRNKGVGKALLFSIWGFTDHFSWGLITASPYAVRALEKATRRRCDAARISRNHKKLLAVGAQYVPYVKSEMERCFTKEEARVNTEFFVDHSEIEKMLAKVVNEEKPWKLGALPDGWEWFAFTFKDQEQLALTSEEIDAMLSASDDVVRQAYSRMQLDSPKQGWAQHTAIEIDFVVKACKAEAGSSVLDLGCGLGRHSIAAAKKGMRVTGVDYVPAFIERARAEARRANADATFMTGDCRSVELGQTYDLVMCLYDVVGTYAENNYNVDIVRNIQRHLKTGGRAVLSVMNYALTERRAQHRFQLSKEPGRLLELQASQTMERSGNVFNPDYYLVDTETQVIYRREQFASGQLLPVELIVRDRRFRAEEIKQLCESAGLTIEMLRFVRAGDWDNALDESDDRAKEILVVCQKR